MRSTRGFLSSITFLLLLPVAVAYQALFENGVEIVIHIVLAVGSALLSLAVFDFKPARWMMWTASVSTGLLAIIFLLQATSLGLPGNEALFYVAFRVFGQGLEGWLGNIFILWCAVMLFSDSHGKTRVFGFVVVGAVICSKVFEYISRFRGETPPESLKLLMLLIFVWLLLESRKKPAGARDGPPAMNARSVRKI